MTQATVQNAQQKINDLISENTALRERMKRMEESLGQIARHVSNNANTAIVMRKTAQAALKEGE